MEGGAWESFSLGEEEEAEVEASSSESPRAGLDPMSLSPLSLGIPS